MRRLLLGFVLIGVLGLCSCAAVLVGAGAGIGIAGYKFVEGQLEVSYIAPYDKVWQATKLALSDLHITTEKVEKDAINAEIKAKKADGKMVIIKIKNKPSGMVWVGIRVGIFGDKDASMIIKKAIDRRLGISGKDVN